MRSDACMEVIHKIEATFPVDRWQAGEIHVWPVIREQLWLHNNEAFAALRRRPGPASASELVGRGAEQASQLGRYLAMRLADRQHDARLRTKADIVFLGDNVSRILVDGSWYDRLCEPLAELAIAQGLTTTHLEPFHIYRRPRHDASRLLQPSLDARWVASRLARKASLPVADLPGYERFLAWLASESVDGSAIGEVSVRRHALRIAMVAEFFGRLLRRLEPGAGVVVDYNATAMGFNLACHRHGIPTIELQHGVQGRLHWAYGGWTKLPAKGFELLPSIYWSWSDYEAEIIRSWAGDGLDGHSAFVGGNLWLERWLGDEDPVVRRYDEEVRGVQAKAGAERNILVTLQTGVNDDAHSGALYQMVGLAPQTWRWWFRTHPTMTDRDRDEVAARLRGLEAGRVEWERASSLPLYALLRHMDAHITYSSSVVIEAARFGVPSVVVDSILEAYPAEAAEGWVVEAKSPSDALEALIAQMNGSRGRSPMRATLPPVEERLAQALAGSRLSDGQRVTSWRRSAGDG